MCMKLAYSVTVVISAYSSTFEKLVLDYITGLNLNLKMCTYVCTVSIHCYVFFGDEYLFM